MSLAQAMLVGRSLEAFINKKRSQEAKNRVPKFKKIAEHTPKQIYDLTIFELSTRAFDIHSGWRDAYKRHREYMRRDILVGRLNPEKFSRRLKVMSFICASVINHDITKVMGK
jgi:transposase